MVAHPRLAQGIEAVKMGAFRCRRQTQILRLPVLAGILAELGRGCPESDAELRPAPSSPQFVEFAFFWCIISVSNEDYTPPPPRY